MEEVDAVMEVVEARTGNLSNVKSLLSTNLLRGFSNNGYSGSSSGCGSFTCGGGNNGGGNLGGYARTGGGGCGGGCWKKKREAAEKMIMKYQNE